MPSTNEDRLSVKQQQKRISDDATLEEILEQATDENNLRNAALNEKEQSIITLYRNGYTQAEIAEKTGVTQGYVSSAIKRINSKIENSFRRQPILKILKEEFVKKVQRRAEKEHHICAQSKIRRFEL